MPAEDDILDDLFLGCAFAAFMQLAVATRDWPEPEPTRRLAYKLYEEALAEKCDTHHPQLGTAAC